jgi:hypothetical protein
VSYVLASFKDRADAVRCHKYASKRYPNARLTLSLGEDTLSSRPALLWPWSVSIPEYVGHQEVVAFVKGFAYALPREASHIMEVACKGDERDRYDTPQEIRL